MADPSSESAPTSVRQICVDVLTLGALHFGPAVTADALGSTFEVERVDLVRKYRQLPMSRLPFQTSDNQVYISKPNDYPHLPCKLLLLLSSGTGIHSINNQLQADKYAAEGFLVVMPDQFAGDPAPTTAPDMPGTDEAEASVIERVKLGLATTAKSFMLDMWLARQTPEKVMPIIERVCDGAKEEFADAVANGGGVYAVGYCFGGKYVCRLASVTPHLDTATPTQSNKAPMIKAGAFAHGTLISPDDFAHVQSPLCLVCVENDQLFPDEVRLAAQETLQRAEVQHEIHMYPDVPHGFAVVGEYPNANVQTAQHQAFSQMLAWLHAH